MCAGEGKVYTWGWSECVPSVKPIAEDGEQDGEQVQEDDASMGATSTGSQLSPKNNVVAALVEPSSSASHLRPTAGGSSRSSKQTGRQSKRNLTCKTTESKGGEDNNRKRKVVSFDDGGSPESPRAAEEDVFAPPCLVRLDPGIKMSTVAAGGRHTLALSGVFSNSSCHIRSSFYICMLMKSSHSLFAIFSSSIIRTGSCM